MANGHFDPLPKTNSVARVQRGGKFIDIEVYGTAYIGGTVTLGGDMVVAGSITLDGGSIEVGDIESSNWDGSSPANLASVDAGASAGYYLDASAGAAQFEGDIWLGGNLTLAGGVIRSATSGLRYELGATGTYAKLDFYSGDASETSAGFLRLIAGASPIMYLKPPSITGKTVAMLVGGDTITITADSVSAQIGTATGNSLQVYDGVGLTLTAYEAGDQILLNQINDGSTADGSATAPALSFVNDPNTGIYRSAADTLNFATGGTNRLSIDSGGAVTLNEVQGDDGAAGDPTFTFASDNDTGLFLASANVLGISTAGGQRINIDFAELRLLSGTHFVAEPLTTGSAANATWINTAGSEYRIQRSTSSIRYKSRVTYNVDYLADIALQPTKHYRKDDKRWRYSFILEDLAGQDKLLANDEDEIDHNAVMAVMAAKINRLEQQIQTLLENAS